MKKTIPVLLSAILILSLAACGAGNAGKAEDEERTASVDLDQAWDRSGYFTDESENMLSITWMDDIDEPGWYVGCMLGDDPTEDSWGGTLVQEGNVLRGDLISSGDKDPLTITVSGEEANGVLLEVDGGAIYHFLPMDIPDATIFVTINTEGWGGMIGYEQGEAVPVLDPEEPYQSAQINLAEPETYTFAAAPEAGNIFVKWKKDGEDFSDEPVITVLLDDSADFVAVFEEDEGLDAESVNQGVQASITYLGGLYVNRDPENDMELAIFKNEEGDLVYVIYELGIYDYGTYTTEDAINDDGREYTKILASEGRTWGYYFSDDLTEGILIGSDGKARDALALDESVARDLVKTIIMGY